MRNEPKKLGLCAKKLLKKDSVTIRFVLLFFWFLFNLEELFYRTPFQGSILQSYSFILGYYFGGFLRAFPIAFVYIFLVEKYWKDSRIFRVTED